MYVCLCHAVTEDDVRGCMANGSCTSAREVKAACGMEAGCGSCTRRLYSLVSEVRTASDLVDAIAGPPMPPVQSVAPAPEPAPGTWVPTSRWLDERREGGSVSAA